jgi:hypothetical protein
MGKKQQKSKAIALTFRPFLATFAIFHKWAKNSKKEGYSLHQFFISKTCSNKIYPKVQEKIY